MHCLNLPESNVSVDLSGDDRFCSRPPRRLEGWEIHRRLFFLRLGHRGIQLLFDRRLRLVRRVDIFLADS